MTYVTYCNIWLKCYINFLCIVADGKRSSNVLAIALNGFNLFLVKIKKNIKNKVYSFFEFGVSVIVAPFSLMSISQVNWSPCLIFSNFTKPIGTTVLKLPALYDMLLLKVTFIHSFLFFFIYNYIVINIYILCLIVMIFIILTLQTFI